MSAAARARCHLPNERVLSSYCLTKGSQCISRGGQSQCPLTAVLYDPEPQVRVKHVGSTNLDQELLDFYVTSWIQFRQNLIPLGAPITENLNARKQFCGG
jgi:hypothetical protein